MHKTTIVCLFCYFVACILHSPQRKTSCSIAFLIKTHHYLSLLTLSNENIINCVVWVFINKSTQIHRFINWMVARLQRCMKSKNQTPISTNVSHRKQHVLRPKHQQHRVPSFQISIRNGLVLIKPLDCAIDAPPHVLLGKGSGLFV